MSEKEPDRFSIISAGCKTIGRKREKESWGKESPDDLYVNAHACMYQRPTNGLRSLGRPGDVMGFAVSGKSKQNKRETDGEIRLSSRIPGCSWRISHGKATGRVRK